jgi:FixJ family two-component response regulator
MLKPSGDCRNQGKSVKERPTVLVVDDDPSVRKAVGRLIRAAGYNAWTFDRPALLLASELPKTNACLLLDVYLPEMDGVELYEKLAATACNLPAILITGRTDARTGRLLQRAKSATLLLKPFDEGLLMEAIARALGSHASEAGL